MTEVEVLARSKMKSDGGDDVCGRTAQVTYTEDDTGMKKGMGV